MICVCSSLLSSSSADLLKERFDLIPLPPDETLARPIQCHPDSIFAVVGNRLIFPRVYADRYPHTVCAIAKESHGTPVLSDAPRASVYPMDVGLNIALWRDVLLCRPQSVSPEVTKSAAELGFRILPVRQGYAGCSCLVTDAAILTCDRGIAKVLDRHSIPHLLLEPGGIFLEGYGNGFLGGACGFHNGEIFINGNHHSLPCYRQLKEFADQQGYRITPLNNGSVTDVGGLRFYPDTTIPSSHRGTYHV